MQPKTTQYVKKNKKSDQFLRRKIINRCQKQDDQLLKLSKTLMKLL